MTGREEVLNYLDEQRAAGVAHRTLSWTFRDTWDGAGRRCCVWCGKPLPPGKQRMRWCKGGKCAAEFLIIKGDMGLIRGKLRAREKEVCQGCGEDLKILAAVLEQDLQVLGRPHCPPKLLITTWGRWTHWFGDKTRREFDRLAGAYIFEVEKRPSLQVEFRIVLDRFARRSLWQADHIVEVQDGGSGTDLSNFQLLCTSCHLRKTNEGKAKKAAARRSQIPPPP